MSSTNRNQKFWSQFPTVIDDAQLLKSSEAALVLQLNQNAPFETLEHLVVSLKQNRLNLQRIVQSENDDDNSSTVFLVTCYETVLANHEKVVYQPQQLKRQVSDSSQELSHSEKQRIIQFILESIKIDKKSFLPGLSNVKCYEGQSLVEVCYRENVILSYFPLHEQDKLDKLKQHNFSAFTHDIDTIRNYFGERVGFYFSFLNLYASLFLVTCSIAAVSYTFSTWYLVPELSTIFICVILLLFWKLWKRESIQLAFKWGTLEAFELENARPTFRSKTVRRDSITNELVPCYPIQKTWIKEYGMSLPIVLVCVYLAFETMCIYFDIENWTVQLYQDNPNILTNILSYVPSIVYTILIVIVNKFYQKLAIKLNDYENHRTQASHENHLIIKLVLFEFVNNFVSLFYIAFYLQNIEMLKWNLFTMLTINQIADNFIEVVYPFLRVYFAMRSKEKLKIADLLTLEESTDTYYDFLELFTQFGFTFLFVCVFPIGPLIGFVNSFIEIRLDGLKLCFSMKRPLQRSAKSVNNGWIQSFQFLTIVATISNLSLMTLTSNSLAHLAQQFAISTFTLVVLLEHLIFLFVLVIWFVVPDTPKQVNVELTRQRYLNLMKLQDSTKKND